VEAEEEENASTHSLKKGKSGVPKKRGKKGKEPLPRKTRQKKKEGKSVMGAGSRTGKKKKRH